jgi:hypothetical protein
MHLMKKRLYFNKVVTRVVDIVNPNGIDTHDTAIITGRKPQYESKGNDPIFDNDIQGGNDVIQN